MLFNLDAEAQIGIIVNKNLYPFVNRSVDNYIKDLGAIEGHEVWTNRDDFSNDNNIEGMKGQIQEWYTENDIEGVILIGDLPIAEYETENDFGKYGYAKFPCDLYFMDLDGQWLDNVQDGGWSGNAKTGVFDDHQGNREMEIWVSRISASILNGLGDEQAIINRYFDRVRDRMRGNDPLPSKALHFCNDQEWPGCYDWGGYGTLGYASGEITDYRRTFATGFQDTPENWKNALREGVEYAAIFEHSSASSHSLTGGGFYSDTYLSMAREPEGITNARFYNLFACSNSRYTSYNNLGGLYALGQNGLLSIGSTKTGAMLGYEYFNRPLSQDSTFGEAFRQWVNDYVIGYWSQGMVEWHYGMCLQGVGNLKLSKYSPFDYADIGNPAIEGSVSSDNGLFTIEAGGRDIWGTSDQFFYIHNTVEGDFEAVAQVYGLSPSDAWAKAGVMVRGSLDANAQHASTFVTATRGVSFQRRPVAGERSYSTTIGDIGAPLWVKIKREGDVFSSYYAGESGDWIELGSATVSMGKEVYVGMAVTSHNVDIPTTAKIGDFSIVQDFVIMASAGEGGTISPDGEFWTQTGDNVQFTMTPEEGYRIVAVWVDGQNIGSLETYTFTNIHANHSIEVTFEEIVYHSIMAVAGPGGSVSPSGEVMVEDGQDAFFSITPDSGYFISSVVVDGSDYGVTWSYTFEKVDSDHSIEASFVRGETLSGMVTLQGMPVEDVEIVAYGSAESYYGYTGSDGYYEILLPAGVYTVEANHWPYISAPEQVIVPLNSQNVDFELIEPVEINLSNLDIKLEPGESTTVTLKIQNNQSKDYPFSILTPSTYHVRFSGEDGGPSYQWTDISGTGQLLAAVSGMDDGSEGQTLSFEFPFYGKGYSEIFVGSNGALSFSEEANLLSSCMFPCEYATPNLVAGLLFDLNPGESGSIYFQDFGDRAIVQYENVKKFGDDFFYTFQIVLHANGDVFFYYKDVENIPNDFIAGIQNAALDNGLNVFFNEAGRIQNGMAVAITAANDWLSAAQRTGIVPPNSTLSIDIDLDAEGLGLGVFHKNYLVIKENNSSPPTFDIGKKGETPPTVDDVSQPAVGNPYNRGVPVTLTVSASYDHFETNGSFEMGSDEWKLPNSHFTVTSEEAALGESSLRYEGVGTNGAVKQTIGLDPDTNYMLMVSMKVASGSTGHIVFDTNDRFDDSCQFVASSRQAGEWIHFAGVFKSGSFDSVTLRAFSTPSFNGVGYFDNVVLIKQPVLNGSFERGLEEWSIQSENYSVSQEESSQGEKSLRYEGIGTGGTANQTITIEPNTYYSLKVSMKLASGSAGSLVFDTDDRFDDTCQFLVNTSDAGKWLHFSGEFYSEWETELKLRAFVTGSFSGVGYFDNVVLEKKRVPNGSFEHGTDFWNVPNDDFSTAKAYSVDGDYSLRYQFSGASRTVKQTVGIEPNADFLLSVSMRMETGSTGKMVFDTFDRFDETCQFVVSPKQAGQWIHFSCYFNSGSETELTLRAFATESSSGVGYFDSIRLTKVGHIPGSLGL